MPWIIRKRTFQELDELWQAVLIMTQTEVRRNLETKPLSESSTLLTFQSVMVVGVDLSQIKMT